MSLYAYLEKESEKKNARKEKEKFSVRVYASFIMNNR